MTSNKKEAPFKFTIDRKKWSRNIDLGRSQNYLYVSRNVANKKAKLKTGTMCCIGHYARACGISIKSISGLGTPEEVSDNILNKNQQFKKLLRVEKESVLYSENEYAIEKTYYCDNILTGMLIDANDNDVSDSKKEKEIKKLFKKINVEVEFIG